MCGRQTLTWIRETGARLDTQKAETLASQRQRSDACVRKVPESSKSVWLYNDKGEFSLNLQKVPTKIRGCSISVV